MKLRIYRYNHEKQRDPWYDFFTLSGDTTVYDALLHIKHEQDGSLTFPRERLGCIFMVNGKPFDASVLLSSFSSGDYITIEPLAHQPVLRDLLCDMQPYFARMKIVRPLGEKQRDSVLTRDVLEHMRFAPDCYQCGACDAFFPKGLRPSQVVRAYPFVCDSRDTKKKERLQQFVKLGIWDMVHLEKADCCPRHIQPSQIVSHIRSLIKDDHVTWMGKGSQYLPGYEPLTKKVGKGVGAAAHGVGKGIAVSSKATVHGISHIGSALGHSVSLVKEKAPNVAKHVKESMEKAAQKGKKFVSWISQQLKK